MRFQEATYHSNKHLSLVYDVRDDVDTKVECEISSITMHGPFEHVLVDDVSRILIDVEKMLEAEEVGDVLMFDIVVSDNDVVIAYNKGTINACMPKDYHMGVIYPETGATRWDEIICINDELTFCHGVAEK